MWNSRSDRGEVVGSGTDGEGDHDPLSTGKDAEKSSVGSMKDVDGSPTADDGVEATDRVSDRKSTRLNSSHSGESRMPSSA